MRAALATLGLICMGGLGCAGGADANGTCNTAIAFDPAMPIAGDTTVVRAIGIITNAPGVVTYQWRVMFNGQILTTQDAQADHSEITFPARQAGVYQVSLDVAANVYCPSTQDDLNVTAPGANTFHGRLRITPPLDTAAPPLVKKLTLSGGGDFHMGPVPLDPGVMVTGAVTAAPSGTPMIAYLRFMPAGMPDAVVESFSDTSGAFRVRVLDQAHDVLVVPGVAGVAPRRISNWMPGDSISLAAGASITGSVHGPSGAPISGAKVQLTIDDVPSSIGTSIADGTFQVFGVPAPGKVVTLVVSPPASTGLPRLETTGILDVGSALDVAYKATLVTRDLAGTHVRRGGSAQPNAKVTIVGSVGATGHVTIGGIATQMTGVVRVTATADGTGALPSTLVPALPLDAVVSVAAGDLAVSALDLTAGVPADIAALAMQPASSTASSMVGGIDGVVLDLVPAGTLAAAGAPTVHLVGDGAGRVTGALAFGGVYDAHWYDPSGTAGPLVVPGLSALSAGYALPKALFVLGTLSVTGSSNPPHGAAVEMLCSPPECVGIDASRPIAAVASDQLGNFAIALPDPGTM